MRLAGIQRHKWEMAFSRQGGMLRHLNPCFTFLVLLSLVLVAGAFMWDAFVFTEFKIQNPLPEWTTQVGRHG